MTNFELLALWQNAEQKARAALAVLDRIATSPDREHAAMTAQRALNTLRGRS